MVLIGILHHLLIKKKTRPTISSPIPEDLPGWDPFSDHDRPSETYNKRVGITRRYSHQRAATLVNGSIDEPLPLLRYFTLRRRRNQKYQPQYPTGMPLAPSRATAYSSNIHFHQHYTILYIYTRLAQNHKPEIFSIMALRDP